MKIIFRKEATNKKLKFYFTGKPCKYGHVNKRYVIGSMCFECRKERQKSEKNKECQRKYRESEKGKRCIELHRKRNNEKYHNNEEFKKRHIEYSLKSNYGITQEEYNAILKLQNYSCAACGLHEDDEHRKLCVDHCHTTGKVRGLLCNSCNTSLGLLKEDVGRILKLSEYIKKCR